MDSISQLYSQYMSSSASSQSTDALKNKMQTSDYSNASDEELMEACKSFEAYFLEQVFKEMMNTIPKSEEESNSQLIDLFKDSAIEDLAKQSTDTQGVGLAQMLYEQMKRNYQ